MSCSTCKHLDKVISKESKDHYLCLCPKLLKEYEAILTKPTTVSCEEYKRKDNNVQEIHS